MKHQKPARSPWVLKLPSAFHVNSSLLFIALMVMILGVAALAGFSDPTSITSKMTLPMYKIWGGALALTGLTMSYGIIQRDSLLEKWSARALSIQLAVFSAWAIAAVGWERSAVTFFMSASIILILEHRISLINVLFYADHIAAAHYVKTSEEEPPTGGE